MFTKPFQVKPYTAVKSSEQRHLFERIQQQSGAAFEPELRAALVPKQIQTAKIVAAGGEKMQVLSVAQVPYYAVINGVYFPTTALMQTLDLDVQLKLCPVVYTLPNTVQFLQSGADFMLPGTVAPLPAQQTKPGSPVQIRDVEGNRLMAVGVALVDFSQLKLGARGRGVSIVNVVGDKLTPKTSLGKLQADSPNNAGSADVGLSAKPNTTESSSAAPVDALAATTLADTAKPSSEPNESEPNEDVEEEPEDEPLTQEEADDAFLFAAAKTIRKPQTLPLAMANFAAQLQDNLPYSHPDLNIKATSFKKLQKLLKYLEKKGEITTKERSGEVKITSISVPETEKVPEAPKPRAVKKKAASANTIKLIAYFKPPPALRALFGPEFQIGKDAYEGSVIKKEILNYIANANIAAPNAEEIPLTDALRKGLGQRLTVASVKRNQVADLALKNCSQFYKLVPPGEDASTLPLLTGAVPHIEVSVDKRIYGKTMTLVPVQGIEKFNLPIPQLCEELRHVCAGSATVINVRGVECMAVQGSHIDKVKRVLVNRGIKPSYIVSK